MLASKYYDSTAAIQVIGSVLNKPTLLDDTGQYKFSENDFCNDLHKVIFGAVYNLYYMGAEHISIQAIEDYLENREKSLAIYRANKGPEWIHRVFSDADIMNFDFYYNRLRKMTLMRAYEDIGMDLSWIYDPDNIFDLALKEKQEETFNSLSLNDLAELIDNRVTRVRELVVDHDTDESCQIGDDMLDLLNELEESPAIGYPLYDNIFSQICMGGRLGKFYLRSAATGVGNIWSF